jgi:ureidoglycolate lyase
MSLAPRVLRPEPLGAAAFAAFGTVIAWDERAPARPINGGTSLRLDLLPSLALSGAGVAPCLALFRARAREFPLPLTEVERHRHGAQLFIPLGALRFVVVVARAQSTPEAASLHAFISNGAQGVVLAPGTWHHALLAVDSGDFVVIERSAAEVDCDTVQLAAEVDRAPRLHLD